MINHFISTYKDRTIQINWWDTFSVIVQRVSLSSLTGISHSHSEAKRCLLKDSNHHRYLLLDLAIAVVATIALLDTAIATHIMLVIIELKANLITASNANMPQLFCWVLPWENWFNFAIARSFSGIDSLMSLSSNLSLVYYWFVKSASSLLFVYFIFILLELLLLSHLLQSIDHGEQIVHSIFTLAMQLIG